MPVDTLRSPLSELTSGVVRAGVGWTVRRIASPRLRVQTGVRRAGVVVADPLTDQDPGLGVWEWTCSRLSSSSRIATLDRSTCSLSYGVALGQVHRLRALLGDPGQRTGGDELRTVIPTHHEVVAVKC